MAREDKYFVLYASEDGEKSIECLTKEELENRLDEDYWGEVNFLSADCDLDGSVGLLIIKGEQINPQAAEVVKKWKV